MFYGKKFETQGNFLFRNIKSYAEFPPIIPPIMSKANTSPRKEAGGFMVATDSNNDIVHPILRPDLDDNDLKMYKEMCAFLGIDPSLADGQSYMQFMNYNQICHLELLPTNLLTFN